MKQNNRSTHTIFYGLPGTSKNTLASRLARKLRWSLLRIDDVTGDVPVDVIEPVERNLTNVLDLVNLKISLEWLGRTSSRKRKKPSIVQ